MTNFLLFLIVTSGYAMAQRPIVHSPDSGAQERIVDALQLLPYSFAKGWIIVASPSDEWFARLRPEQVKHAAGTCYSELHDHVTYCRLEWIKTATVREVAHWLGHELGHLVCKCEDEGRADTFARSFVNRH